MPQTRKNSCIVHTHTPRETHCDAEACTLTHTHARSHTCTLTHTCTTSCRRPHRHAETHTENTDPVVHTYVTLSPPTRSQNVYECTATRRGYLKNLCCRQFDFSPGKDDEKARDVRDLFPFQSPVQNIFLFRCSKVDGLDIALEKRIISTSIHS